jgi:hypothetical protein
MNDPSVFGGSNNNNNAVAPQQQQVQQQQVQQLPAVQNFVEQQQSKCFIAILYCLYFSISDLYFCVVWRCLAWVFFKSSSLSEIPDSQFSFLVNSLCDFIRPRPGRIYIKGYISFDIYP